MLKLKHTIFLSTVIFITFPCILLYWRCNYYFACDNDYNFVLLQYVLTVDLWSKGDWWWIRSFLWHSSL